MEPDKEILIKSVTTRMPFGKYKGVFICDLPVHYLEWFSREGFPAGKLGQMLSTIYIMKTNGLSDMIPKIKRIVRRG